VQYAIHCVCNVRITPICAVPNAKAALQSFRSTPLANVLMDISMMDWIALPASLCAPAAPPWDIALNASTIRQSH